MNLLLKFIGDVDLWTRDTLKFMKVALAFIKSNDLTVLYTVLNKLLISPVQYNMLILTMLTMNFLSLALCYKWVLL